MRIAIFTETFLPKWDGVTNTLCYLLEHLAAADHSSLMFAPRGGPAVYAQTPIVGLPGFTFPLYPSLKLAFPWANVHRQLAAFRPDLIHLVNPAILGLAGLRHAYRLNTPIVASYHTDIPGYAQQYRLPFLRDPLWAYFRWLHNQADLNLCPSPFTQKQLMAQGFQRVRIWGRGVDTERFNPCRRSEEWRQRLCGGQTELPLLLYAGRLAAEKRIDWLRHVLDAVPNVRLALVGDGPARPELEALFAGTPTVLAGYLKGHDLACAYAAADLFVFPSANETFGNVVLEAMASGLPVVTVNSGGPVDHIADGENGFLCDADRVDDMIARVQRLVSSPALTQQLGLNARRWAETQTWSRILDGLLADYAQTIQTFKPRHRPAPGKPAPARKPQYSPSSH